MPPTEDDGYERIPIADWDAMRSALEAFAAGGTVESDGEALTVRTGSAHLTVTPDGTVTTGMPLHGFEATGVEAVFVDAEGGRIQISDDDRGVAYEFRRP